MKNKSLVFGLIVLFAMGCHNHHDLIRRVDEVPKDVTNLQLCETLYANILNLFKEGRNNMDKYPALFDKNANHKIVLNKDTEVFVTFIGEGAGLSNTLGWYAYKDGEMNQAGADVRNQIIFPHIANSVLSPGDTRQVSIGKFEAGTVIGFYLVVGGWNKESSAIDFTKPIIYTDASLNRDGAVQHLLFNEKQCNDVVVGFEDLYLPASDYDFNDILFKVSDNDQKAVSTAFDMQLIPSL
jgi:hypothetical protein